MLDHTMGSRVTPNQLTIAICFSREHLLERNVAMASQEVIDVPSQDVSTLRLHYIYRSSKSTDSFNSNSSYAFYESLRLENGTDSS